MPTDPFGNRFPDSTYAATIWTWIEQAVRDLGPKGIPTFSTTTARNTAYTNWITAGGTWRLGLFCTVNGVLYTSGATTNTWDVVPTTYETKMMRAQRTVNTYTLVNAAYTAFSSNTDWTEDDPWGMHSSGATLNAVWTGWYQINAGVTFNNNATGIRGIRLVPGGSYDIGGGTSASVSIGQVPAATGGTDTNVTGAHLTKLTAGQTVQLEAYQSSGTSLQINDVRISAAYLGPNT